MSTDKETQTLGIVVQSMHRSSKTVRAVLEKHGVTMRKYGVRAQRKTTETRKGSENILKTISIVS